MCRRSAGAVMIISLLWCAVRISCHTTVDAQRLHYGLHSPSICSSGCSVKLQSGIKSSQCWHHHLRYTWPASQTLALCYSMADHAAPWIVLDVGSSHTRAGFAGNMQVGVLLPAAVMRWNSCASSAFTLHCSQPTWNIPTLLAMRCNDGTATHGPAGAAARARGQLGDLDICIGEEAANNSLNPAYTLSAPLRQAVVCHCVGCALAATAAAALLVAHCTATCTAQHWAQVEDWDALERFQQQCLFQWV
jgi:hypothetical protein